MAVMLVSDSGWRIELFKREGVSPRTVNPDAVTQHDTLGFGHLCLTVDDIEAAHDRVLALGGKSFFRPKSVMEDAGGPALEAIGQGHIRVTYMADPEGNLIELQQR
jgi:catechol 2,3-dioxygenase-like lactoylglutathione lyase family enzyme